MARRRAAGGTHGGFRHRKLEPGGRRFRRGTEHVVNGTSLTLTRSGRFTLSVTARQLGYVSPAAYVTVESQDGEYVA